MPNTPVRIRSSELSYKTFLSEMSSNRTLADFHLYNEIEARNIIQMLSQFKKSERMPHLKHYLPFAGCDKECYHIQAKWDFNDLLCFADLPRFEEFRATLAKGEASKVFKAFTEGYDAKEITLAEWDALKALGIAVAVEEIRPLARAHTVPVLTAPVKEAKAVKEKAPKEAKAGKEAKGAKASKIDAIAAQMAALQAQMVALTNAVSPPTSNPASTGTRTPPAEEAEEAVADEAEVDASIAREVLLLEDQPAEEEEAVAAPAPAPAEVVAEVAEDAPAPKPKKSKKHKRTADPLAMAGDE